MKLMLAIAFELYQLLLWLVPERSKTYGALCRAVDLLIIIPGRQVLLLNRQQDDEETFQALAVVVPQSDCIAVLPTAEAVKSED